MKLDKGGELEATILRYLHRHGKIGHVYLSFDLVVRNLPSHLRGCAKKVVKEMVRQGLLLASKHHFGIGISLNINRLNEIEELIKKNFPDYVF